MGEVVDNKQVNCHQEYCRHIAHHNLSMKIVEFRNADVDGEGDDEEDTGNSSAGSVHISENWNVSLEAGGLRTLQ